MLSVRFVLPSESGLCVDMCVRGVWCVVCYRVCVLCVLCYFQDQICHVSQSLVCCVMCCVLRDVLCVA